MALPAAFDFQSVKALQTAHDQACFHLTEPDGKGPSWNTRRLLAQRILQCAETGERDVVKLKGYALAGVASLLAAQR